MKRLETGSAVARSERHSTFLLHDEPNGRVVEFHLREGQAVPVHRSDSTVLVHVLDGEGVFRGEGGEVRLVRGGAAVFDPGESHSIESVGGALRFLAVIMPRP